jgi:extradiol dioxygenase family protein
MKQNILLLAVVFCSVFTPTQAQIQTDTTKYVYCELVGTSRLLSTKITITVDFGEHMNVWRDNRMKDEQTGRVKVFNSMIDALNLMGDDGWEFVQAYVVTIGQQNVYHWLLKRRRYGDVIN